MYIDSLTITALVIFLVSLAIVIRYCVFGLCGGPRRHRDEESVPGE